MPSFEEVSDDIINKLGKLQSAVLDFEHSLQRKHFQEKQIFNLHKSCSEKVDCYDKKVSTQLQDIK